MIHIPFYFTDDRYIICILTMFFGQMSNFFMKGFLAETAIFYGKNNHFFL